MGTFGLLFLGDVLHQRKPFKRLPDAYIVRVLTHPLPQFPRGGRGLRQRPRVECLVKYPLSLRMVSEVHVVSPK